LKKKKRWYLFLILIVVSVLLTILFLIYLLTNIYRDKAILYFKNYLDTRLTTEIHIRKNDIHFNLLKNFPNVSIDLDNILVKSATGPDYSQFNLTCKDTLLYAERLSCIFNIRSLITNKYELKKIELANADLNILLDKMRRGNYLIFKADPGSTKKDTFSIDLRKIKFDNVRINYNDVLTDFILSTYIKTSNITGNFSENDFQFFTSLETENTYIKAGARQFLYKESFKLNININKNKLTYTFKDGVLNLEGIKIIFNGELNSLHNNYNFNFDCKSAHIQQFEDTYLKRFINKSKYVPIKGNINFALKISGTSKGTPKLILRFNIIDGIFLNKDDNIRIENFYIRGSYTNGKYSNSTTSKVVIDTMFARSGKSNISLRAALENFNEPNIKGLINGNFELDKLSTIDGIRSRLELTGTIATRIKIEGKTPSLNAFKLSDLKKLNIEGLMQFNNIFIKSLTNQLPSANASGRISFINLNEINLNDINLSIGKSSFIIDGTVSNIPLFNENKEAFPTYKCTVSSPEFYVEDFLIHENGETKTDKKFKAEFPDSIIVFASFRAQTFSFGKFSATNVKAEVSYQPKILRINEFSMNSQDGIISSDIDLYEKDGQFIANCNSILKQINIHNLFYSFNNFGQSIISSENLEGKISGYVHVSEIWDQNLNPVLDKLTLQSDYEIVDGEINNYEPLQGLSKYIEVDELKHIHFDSLFSSVSVNQSTVYLSQTDIHSSALSLIGSGEHHFDNSYIYKIQVKLSDVLWSKAKKKKPANEEFGYEVDDGLGQTILPLIIIGKGTDYVVNYDKKTAVKEIKNKLKKEKEDWKVLLSPDQNKTTFDPVKNDQKIDWNEDIPINKENKIVKDTTKKKEEFKIQWNDD
jgi:hypothetical protein